MDSESQWLHAGWSGSNIRWSMNPGQDIGHNVTPLFGRVQHVQTRGVTLANSSFVNGTFFKESAIVGYQMILLWSNYILRFDLIVPLKGEKVFNMILLIYTTL